MPQAKPYPDVMKAVFVEKPSCKLILTETRLPEPGPGDVLVKISHAPVNPSDIARIRDFCSANSENFVPGLEGSGIVVAAGKGMLPKLWLGKRVACSAGKHGGTWAEYMVTSASKCFPLSSKVSDEQGSMMLVNPLTALAFIDIAKKEKHKAIINNAAASSLGRMLELLGKKEKIEVINMVRKNDQAEMLRSSGSSYVLNSAHGSFISDLETLAGKLNATMFLDTVCNDQLPEIISILPAKSSVIIYGNRSDAGKIRVNPRDLIDKNISLRGFYLGSYAAENSLLRNMLNLRKIGKMMKNDLKIKIRQKFPLEKAMEALELYSSGMSAGKVLLSPFS